MKFVRGLIIYVLIPYYLSSYPGNPRRCLLFGWKNREASSTTKKEQLQRFHAHGIKTSHNGIVSPPQREIEFENWRRHRERLFDGSGFLSAGLMSRRQGWKINTSQLTVKESDRVPFASRDHKFVKMYFGHGRAAGLSGPEGRLQCSVSQPVGCDPLGGWPTLP